MSRAENRDGFLRLLIYVDSYGYVFNDDDFKELTSIREDFNKNIDVAERCDRFIEEHSKDHDD